MLGRLLKKKKEEEEEEVTKIRKSRMSDFSCEGTKVCMDSYGVPMARVRERCL